MTQPNGHRRTLAQVEGARVMPSVGDGRRGSVELRQLRYFITLADELHFGRAAAREHIVQSALSQQVQRLERSVGVQLLERTTRRVELTAAGRRFLPEARRILAGVERAVGAAQRAAGIAPTLRIGVTDENYDSVQHVLRALEDVQPELEVHQVHAGVPDQVRLLLDGRLDVGFGRSALVPVEIASDVVRRDPLGVLLPRSHRLADQAAVPVASLDGEPMLLASPDRAPEYNDLVVELCRTVGFAPTCYRGTVQSLRAAADLVAAERCAVCVPRSAVVPTQATVWRPLVAPASSYPWSVLWRGGDDSEVVAAFLRCARGVSRERDWMRGASPAARTAC